MSDEIKKVLNSEKLSYELYSKLERIERNKQLKKKLRELKELDVKHIKVWTEIYNELNIPVKENGNKLSLFLFILLRRLFGSGLTLSVINSLENRKVSDLSKIFDVIPDKQREKVVNYLVEELYQERILKKESWESGVLSHIRDVVFGMNDGLVEVLAAVAGFTGAIHNNLLIAVAGTIVGLSGTISMAVGAYLSSKSEKDLEFDGINRLELELQVAKERLKEDLEKHSLNYKNFDKSLEDLISKLKKEKDPIYKVLERERKNPLMNFISGNGKIYQNNNPVNPVKDALYVGVFYVFGAVIPLISFLIGSIIKSNTYYNLVISVVLTSIAIALTSLIIALNSNEKVFRYIGRALGLSLTAAFVTFLVGHLASVYLHIAI
ncbi:MAG: VIT1/CCC1 transporter family protein [Candidatus Parvarchaeota archaeon]|nr:VIT1/CCC1 transporter family protein [Candidatus Parvarchaeota archaeon]MCW1294901.1 VIT1/CCC1 transporter family protein [Candidatus Parvarchaeum tengchongense]MCW1295844.1 VIT1/CCC1 transporter family protein [Candidatus Parvarchaeum tengchongense]MCW1298995.1 VIT1/CCC1 transporter family protein [Candidatus Parvarchaeum tengchongense]MCW1312349.1 VIT1/CCC1 transporter family protein [Candidatus Parvarchaeum tengchongense]